MLIRVIRTGDIYTAHVAHITLCTCWYTSANTWHQNWWPCTCWYTSANTWHQNCWDIHSSCGTHHIIVHAGIPVLICDIKTADMCTHRSCGTHHINIRICFIFHWPSLPLHVNTQTESIFNYSMSFTDLYYFYRLKNHYLTTCSLS